MHQPFKILVHWVFSSRQTKPAQSFSFYLFMLQFYFFHFKAFVMNLSPKVTRQDLSQARSTLIVCSSSVAAGLRSVINVSDTELIPVDLVPALSQLWIRSEVKTALTALILFLSSPSFSFFLNLRSTRTIVLKINECGCVFYYVCSWSVWYFVTQTWKEPQGGRLICACDCVVYVMKLGLQYNRCALPAEQRSHTLRLENQSLLLKVNNNCKNCGGMKA